MKSNGELQKEVEKELRWEPSLHGGEIGVTAKDGVITLTGTVSSFGKKLEAEDAAKKVGGVKVVVEKIEVVLNDIDKVTDDKIAREVLNAFQWNWKIPNHKIKVRVEEGWVTLEGDVRWHFQKEAAKKALNNLIGVKGVINEITIKSETDDEIEMNTIKLAFGRNASVNSNNLQVTIKNNNVSLNGKVKNWYQKQEAGRLAFNAPGVETVDNQLVVEHSQSFLE